MRAQQQTTLSAAANFLQHLLALHVDVKQLVALLQQIETIQRDGGESEVVAEHVGQTRLAPEHACEVATRRPPRFD